MGTVIFNVNIHGPLWAWWLVAVAVYLLCGASYVCALRRMDWPIIGLNHFDHERQYFDCHTDGSIGAVVLFWPFIAWTYPAYAAAWCIGALFVFPSRFVGRIINRICKPR